MEGSAGAVTRRRVRGDIEWIAISGELDMASAPEARECLLAAAARSSTWIPELIVVGCNPGVRRIFDQAGVAGALRFISSPDDALELVDG